MKTNNILSCDYIEDEEHSGLSVKIHQNIDELGLSSVMFAMLEFMERNELCLEDFFFNLGPEKLSACAVSIALSVIMQNDSENEKMASISSLDEMS